MDRESGLLDAVVAAHRSANATLAASILALEQFYDARMAAFDTESVPRPLDAERIAHTSALAEVACACRLPAGAVEDRLKIWWGSRPAFRDMFTAGEITLEVLRTIRDHTLGAPAAVVAAIEPDIVTATAYFTPIRLGREIDRMITAHNPDWDTRARRRAASTTKKVRVTALPRGMARMAATVGAVDAAELAALIDIEVVRVCGLDPRTLDTRRSDAFLALVRGGRLTCLCAHPDCPAGEGEGRAVRDESSAEGDEEGGAAQDNEDSARPEPKPEPDSPDAPDSPPSGGAGSNPEPSRAAHSCECGRPLPAYQGSAHPGQTVPPTTPLINITADLETVLGLHDNNAYLHGYGTLDPATLRAMARDATWQIIFTTSRRFLDTLTDLHSDPPDPPTPSPHSPQCTCTCGGAPRPGATAKAADVQPFSEYLAAAAAEHNRHISQLRTRMAAPTKAQKKDDRRRARLRAPDNVADDIPSNIPDDTDGSVTWDPDTLAATIGPEPVSEACDVVLGRTRALPAGKLPAGKLPEPTSAPARRPTQTAAALAARCHRAVAADPTHAHAEYPDGHGGHPTPPPGALTYTPGAALAMWVRAHYPTCRHPGCNVPSSACDLDHLVEFDHRHPERGGWTITTNLAPYCRTHHNLKTSKHWRIERLHDDVLHTTDPHGNHYFSPPEL
ncbi:MAG: DUF222 domain-containing protein [Rhodococcus sp. (in: high G+C Gram-positive bacteria)]